MKRKRKLPSQPAADGAVESPRGAAPASPAGDAGSRFYLISLALLILTASVYIQVHDHEFFEIDDLEYISMNPHVNKGLTREALVWSFTTEGYASAWHPLTWISHIIDCELYGVDPTGHLLTNVAFHLANVFLLFLVLTRSTGALWPSALVAALFAVHPLNVESVAWAAERKNTLSTLFWFLTMWAYVRYTERPTIARNLSTCAFLALGLLSKPMLVTVPVVLLLMDVWPLNRMKFSWSFVGRLIWEKMPLIALVAISIAFTMLVEHKGAGVSLENLPVEYRVANAFMSYLKYIHHMIWPQNITYFYPHPGMGLPVWQGVVAATILLAVTILTVLAVRTKPYLAMGWLWYLITLLPVIGLIQVGRQAMADRYMYVSLIGLFILIAWGIPDLLADWKRKKAILSIGSAAVIAALAFGTWVQVGHWRTSVTMYEHALSVNPANFQAHYNLANARFDRGDLDGAIEHYSETIRLKPSYYPAAYLNTGSAYARKGLYDNAIRYFNDALILQPNTWTAHKNLGFCFLQKGNLDTAALHYARALEINPSHAFLSFELGNLLARQGKLEAAVERYEAALRINPNMAEARMNLETARRMMSGK